MKMTKSIPNCTDMDGRVIEMNESSNKSDRH